VLSANTNGFLLATIFLLLPIQPGCKRPTGPTPLRSSATASLPPRDPLCVEQEQGCLYCSARGTEPQPLLFEHDQSRPVLCNPQEESDCVEFCTALAPECALPWSQGQRCLVENEASFHRAVFNRDTTDRPEGTLLGRLIDEGGRRIEGASVDVWVSRPNFPTVTLSQEQSGKDGSFKLHLRLGPWAYVLRIRKPGLATEIVQGPLLDKLLQATANGQPRTFRLGKEQVVKGRVIEAGPGTKGIGGVEVSAVRNPEEWIEVGHTITADDGTFTLGGLENRKYAIRATKFGWKPSNNKNLMVYPSKITLRLVRATVIRGTVEDSEGDPEPYATVAALLSEAPGLPTTPIFWASDAKGAFAQDRFAPGVYYLWARKGDMLAYPPEKIELMEGGEADVTLSLSHKGSKVKGKILGAPGYPLSTNLRVLLSSRSSPLAFPRPCVAPIEVGTGLFALQGILPGRYEISVRDGTRSLAIVSGAREVEIPIDADNPVQLRDPILVRPLSGE
jgi:hypothetical protein